jgi:hypothetical protein
MLRVNCPILGPLHQPDCSLFPSFLTPHAITITQTTLTCPSLLPSGTKSNVHDQMIYDFLVEIFCVHKKYGAGGRSVFVTLAPTIRNKIIWVLFCHPDRPTYVQVHYIWSVTFVIFVYICHMGQIYILPYYCFIQTTYFLCKANESANLFTQIF